MGIFPAVNLYMIFVHSKLTVSVLTLLKWRASCSLGLIFLLKENKKQNDEVGDSFTEKYWARDSVAGTMWAWGWSEMKGSESHSVVSNSLDPMDYTVHRILQATVLERVAVPFSKGSSQSRDWTQVSPIADRFFTVWAWGVVKYTIIHSWFGNLHSQQKQWDSAIYQPCKSLQDILFRGKRPFA